MAVVRHQTRDVRLDEIARRIQNEFIEMPGMRLTSAQIRKLWHLSQEECDHALALLLREQLLATDSARRFYLQGSRTPLGRGPLRRLERSA